jgi:hypothetical protein
MPSASRVDYPLPPDPNAPHGDEGDAKADLTGQMEVGVVESREVGHDGGAQCYGIDHTGPAGGGVQRNIKD